LRIDSYGRFSAEAVKAVLSAGTLSFLFEAETVSI